MEAKRQGALVDRVAAALGLTTAELMDPKAPPLPETDFFSTRSAWAIASRSPRSGPNRLEPWDESHWPELDKRLSIADLEMQGLWARHPHVTVRRIVARSPNVDPDVLDRLAEDSWSEVRAAVLMNPSAADPTIQRRAQIEPNSSLQSAADRRSDTGSVADVGCVACGGPIKNRGFSTCSVKCSLRLTKLRLDNGTWASIKLADPGNRRGIRDAWPDEYRWRVAAGAVSGGVPRSGPRLREVVLAFVPGVTAAELIAAVLQINRAGLPGPGAVRVMEHLASEIEGPDELSYAVDMACAQDLTPDHFLTD